MSNDAARKANAVRREFPETEAAFRAVRAAMVDRLFSTPVIATDERERLYISVQVLDAVRKSLMDAMATGQIEDYAATLRREEN